MNLASILLASGASGAQSAAGSITVMIAWVAGCVLIMYLLMVKPQKKQQRELESMLSSLEVGDSVLTTGGFYGVIIDISDEVVIVEFGNNKNCRIPMKKGAIVEVEKAADGIETESK